MEDEAEKMPRIRRVSHRFLHFFFRFVWTLKVAGLENVPRAGPVIIAFNHISWWDGPVAIFGLGFTRYLRFPGKAELFDTPLLGWFLKEVGMFPLNRGRSDVQAIRTAVDLVRQGGSLGLFPEGTRSKTGLIGRPKAGVGFLARETGAPVVPARLLNTDKLFYFRPLEVRFGPPLRFEGGAGDRAECQNFAQKVMDRIAAL